MNLLGLLFLLFLGPCVVSESSSTSSESHAVPISTIDDKIDSFLKNAATAAESYAITHNGRYTMSVKDLINEGLRIEPKMTLIITDFGRGVFADYCLEAQHIDSDSVAHYSSDE